VAVSTAPRNSAWCHSSPNACPTNRPPDSGSSSAIDPLAGARAPLYARGRAQVQAPGLPVDAAAVAAYAATLPADRLTLRFHTPLRLTEKRNGTTRLVHRFEPQPFFARLAWRLDQLALAYGGGQSLSDYAALPEQVARVMVANDQSHWGDVVSYSSRTRSRTPIGGLVGDAQLRQVVTQLGPLIARRQTVVDEAVGLGAGRCHESTAFPMMSCCTSVAPS